MIPIYEAGEQDGRLFIAMRYVPNRDLKGLLRNQPPRWSRRASDTGGRED